TRRNPLPALERLFRFDLVVQPFAEARRHRIFHAVCYELNHVSRSVQNRSAMRTHLEVRFHARAQFRVDLPVEEIGDLAPYLQAADFDHLHWIQSGPISFTGATPPPTTAAPSHTRACPCSSFRRSPVLGRRASGNGPEAAASSRCQRQFRE